MPDKVQKIRNEVERLQNELIQEREKGFGSDVDDACILELQNVLTYIDSLQEEPVSEDKMTISKEWFEHCKKSWYNEGYIDGEYNRDRQFEDTISEELEEASKNYALNNTPWDDCVNEMQESFKAGAKWQKEQMMAKAVDGWVFRGIKDGKLRISDNKECWNGIRVPEKSIEKSYLFCTTDDAIKVKLVIVKED